MTRTASIWTKYSGTIEEAASRFGDHEGMSPERVCAWMSQFSDAHLPLAKKLLEQMRYLNATNIRTLSKRLVEMVADEVGLKPETTVFVPMSQTPGGGADLVARALRRVEAPFTPRMATMVDLMKPPETLETVVFVDDFSGTGDTLVEWWQTVEPIVRPLGAAVVFSALVMTSDAADRANDLGTAIAVDEVAVEANVFHDDNPQFDAAEKATILSYCKKTGCSNDFLRGYKKSGLILSFKHGCPNNSIPILWYSRKDWYELFQRRAL